MFLANSLKDKIKRSFLENSPNTLEKAKFSYSPRKRNEKVLLSFIETTPDGISPYPEGLHSDFTTQKLQSLDKKEWQDTFTLQKLRQEWKRKTELDFEPRYKKFPDSIMLPKVVQSKEYIKELTDPDPLDLKQRRWNISCDAHNKFEPELKKTVFELSHGLKDFKIVPIKEKKVEEGCDSRNLRTINGETWEVSTLFEKNNMKTLSENNKENAVENSKKYWESNQYNRENEKPFPISEDRKKFELIRYFKKYRTPYQNTLDLYNTMNKVHQLTELKRENIENKVKYSYPGIEKYPEKINALVDKQMYNIYKDKYNELTGRLDKEEMKRRQREANRFHWKDDDLVNKMLAVSNMKDKSWFKPEFTVKELSNSTENLNKEMLKSLVMNGNDIHIEEDKIKDKLEEEYKKQQKKELLLKEKNFSHKKKKEKMISRYPKTKEELELMKRSFKMSLTENENRENSPWNSITFSPHFLDAYKKVTEDEITKLNKLYRKNKGMIEFEYSHPGAYREFEYEEIISNTDPETGRVKNEKKKVKNYLWSCCMNSDKDSKGCQRKIIKKFKWLYD